MVGASGVKSMKLKVMLDIALLGSVWKNERQGVLVISLMLTIMNIWGSQIKTINLNDNKQDPYFLSLLCISWDWDSHFFQDDH